MKRRQDQPSGGGTQAQGDSLKQSRTALRRKILNPEQQRVTVLSIIYGFERRKYELLGTIAGRFPARNPLISPVPEYLIRGAGWGDVDSDLALLDLEQRGKIRHVATGGLPYGRFQVKPDVILDVSCREHADFKQDGSLVISVKTVTPYIDYDEVSPIRRRVWHRRVADGAPCDNWVCSVFVRACRPYSNYYTLTADGINAVEQICIPKLGDLIPLAKLRGIVPTRVAGGDSTDLANWLVRNGVRTCQPHGRRRYADRSELIRVFRRYSRILAWLNDYGSDDQLTA